MVIEVRRVAARPAAMSTNTPFVSTIGDTESAMAGIGKLIAGLSQSYVRAKERDEDMRLKSATAQYQVALDNGVRQLTLGKDYDNYENSLAEIQRKTSEEIGKNLSEENRNLFMASIALPNMRAQGDVLYAATKGKQSEAVGNLDTYLDDMSKAAVGKSAVDKDIADANVISSVNDAVTQGIISAKEGEDRLTSYRDNKTDSDIKHLILTNPWSAEKVVESLKLDQTKKDKYRQLVQKELVDRQLMEETRIKESNEALMVEAIKALDPAKSKGVPRELLEAMPEDTRRAYIIADNAARSGSAVQTDPDAFDYLSTMAGENPDRFNAVNLYSYMDRLSLGDLQGFKAMQDSMSITVSGIKRNADGSTSVAKKAKLDDEFKMDSDLKNMMYEMMGIGMSNKSPTVMAQRYNFNQLYAQEASALQIKKGLALTASEKRDAAMKLAREMIVKDSGIFRNTRTRPGDFSFTDDVGDKKTYIPIEDISQDDRSRISTLLGSNHLDISVLSQEQQNMYVEHLAAAMYYPVRQRDGVISVILTEIEQELINVGR